jgi:hypothetical protein
MTRFNDARLAILGRQIPRQHEKDRRVCLANTPQCEYEGLLVSPFFAGKTWLTSRTHSTGRAIHV